MKNHASAGPEPEETQTIRCGSPFRGQPVPRDPSSASLVSAIAPPFHPSVLGEDIYFQASPLRYTAMGSVVAAAMVAIFAAFGAYFFPIGGAITAGLGCLLAVFGLYSHRRFAATLLLSIHLTLFLYCYSQAI